MRTVATLSDTAANLEALAAEPAAAAVDGQSASNRSAADVNALTVAAENRRAVANRRCGLIYRKFLPSGALPDNGRAGQVGGFNVAVY